MVAVVVTVVMGMKFRGGHQRGYPVDYARIAAYGR